MILILCSFSIKPIVATRTEITSLYCINANDFVIGAKDGSVYHCWSSVFVMRKNLEITNLKKHTFMVTSLMKTKMNGQTVIISCDLNGQIYFHDIRTADEVSPFDS